VSINKVNNFAQLLTTNQSQINSSSTDTFENVNIIHLKEEFEITKRQNLEYQNEINVMKETISKYKIERENKAKEEINSTIEKLIQEKEMLLKALEIERGNNNALSKENLILQDKIKFLEGLVAKFQLSQIREEDKCKICNEDLADWVVFPCQEIFCMKCAKNLVLKQCPICQKMIHETKPLG